MCTPSDLWFTLIKADGLQHQPCLSLCQTAFNLFRLTWPLLMVFFLSSVPPLRLIYSTHPSLFIFYSSLLLLPHLFIFYLFHVCVTMIQLVPYSSRAKTHFQRPPWVMLSHIMLTDTVTPRLKPFVPYNTWYACMRHTTIYCIYTVCIIYCKYYRGQITQRSFFKCQVGLSKKQNTFLRVDDDGFSSDVLNGVN